jgi:hypothetical protein
LGKGQAPTISRCIEAQFAAIGIEKGKPFAADARMKNILEEATAAGDATVRSLTYRTRIKEAYFYPNSA